MNKIKNLEMSEEIVLDSANEPNAITKAFKNGRGEQKRKLATGDMRIQPALAGLEDGRGPLAKECMQSLKAGKGREIDSPLVPPKRNTALLTLGF